MLGLIAVIIPILVGYFLVTGLATSSSYTLPGGATTTTTAATSAGPGSSVAISIPSGAASPSNPPGYAPDKVTIVLGVNSSVTWTNADTAPHTVTSTSVPAGAAAFDSGNMNAGQAYTYNFTTPGTYQYHCSYHSWMTGTVVVVGTAPHAATGVKLTIDPGSASPSVAPGYTPDKITLVIGVNNTVTWSNTDTEPHTVTSTSVPSGASAFDSGNMVESATYSHTFSVPGTYQYHCNYHSWMTGTITVVQGK